MALRKIILTHNSKLSNFDKMLKEVFPSSIPSQYCDKLIITDERGNESELMGSDIEGAIPLDPNHSSDLSRLWNKHTEKVEIYLNLAKVEAVVTAGTDELFKNANLK